MSHPFKGDPYRKARKNSSQEYSESPLESYHSRTPSESSTSRLAATVEDPYAPRSHQKKKKKNEQQEVYYYENEKRANSYLPYSNHKRDPFHTESIHLQEEHNTHHHVGSMLHDNIVMDMMNDDNDQHEAYYQPNTYKKPPSTIMPTKKQPWWRRLGLSGKKLVFIAFTCIAVVGVIWYFVWPRTPTLMFIDAELADNTVANYSSTTMLASWNVNFTVINSENWIPTNINNLQVNVVEDSTGVIFGTGNSGHLMLKGRSIEQIITIPIYINFTRNANDPTLKTLLNACGTINQDLSSSVSPKQSLNIRFNIIYYIAGIVWHPVASITPQSYFQCP